LIFFFKKIALTQSIVYEFIKLVNGEVRICDENNPKSIQLPATETNVPCICSPGQELNANGQCQYCPSGTSKNETQTTCEPCVPFFFFSFFFPFFL